MTDIDSPFLDLSRSVKRIASALLAILENRVELFSLEVREQQYYFVRLLLFVIAFMFFAMLAVALIIATVLYALDAEARMIGLIITTGIFVVIALYLVVRVILILKNYPSPFSQTITEIKKDRKSL